MTSHRTLLFTVGTGLLFAAALSACSTAPSPTPAPAVSPAPASSAPADSGSSSSLKPCDIVNSSLISATLGVDPGAGVATTDTCTYKNGPVSIVVQSSNQADLFFPQSLYAAAQIPGAVDLAGGDISYGYYVPTPDSGNLGNVTVFIAKGKNAILFTGNIAGPGSADAAHKLATAIALAF